MSLIPEHAGFHERVEACFAAYRGRGVMLSALDVELLDSWAQADVPFEVIARGIRKAAEAVLFDAAVGEDRLRSLRATRKHVEAEIRKYLKASAGQHQPGAEAERSDGVEGRRKALEKSIRRDAKQYPALARLLASAPEESSFARLERLEHLAYALVLRAQTATTRRSLLREARALVQKAAPLSPAVRLESLRFHREALLKRHLSWKGL